MRRREFITLVSSAGALWTLSAEAQQSAGIKRIAVVHPIASPELMTAKSGLAFYRGFFSELNRLGYVEGKNLIVERRSGEGGTERYAEIARELVGLNPDVLVVVSARLLEYFRRATSTIPIIASTGDPILFNIVSNLARPEGNITGFSADASLRFMVSISKS
jgi:putative ABC transport system substrate-binding protein